MPALKAGPVVPVTGKAASLALKSAPVYSLAAAIAPVYCKGAATVHFFPTSARPVCTVKPDF